MSYTTQHLANLFQVSPQTIKNWAGEFAMYLSPTATPGAGKARQFTDDDAAVLALVAEIKRAGGVYETIHAALANGQRGELPSEGELLSQSPAALATVVSLRGQLMDAQSRIRELEATLERERGEKAAHEKRLKELEQEVRELYKTVGRLEDRINPLKE